VRRAIAAGLVAVATLAPGTLAAATPGTAALAPRAVEEPAPVTAMVTQLSPTIAMGDDTVTAVVTLDNGAATPVDDAVVTLSVTTGPLTDRSALAAFVADPESSALREAAMVPEPAPIEEAADEQGEQDQDGEGTAADGADGDADAGPDAEPVDEPAGIEIGPGARSTVTVSATADELGLPANTWGVYGLVVTVEVGGQATLVDAMPITWADADVPALNVAVLAQATGTEARVDALLAASAIDGVAIALDPTEITNATAFEHGLVERDVYRLPAGLPDITSLAHGDDAEVLDLSLSLPASTSVGALDDAPWLSVPAAVDRSSVTFSARHGTAAVLATHDAPGFEDAADAGSPAAEAAVDDGSVTVLVPDAGLSATLADYRPGTPAAAAVLVADSALTAAQSGGDTVLIAPGSAWRLGETGVSTPLEALADAPWTTVVPVADLLGQGASGVELVEVLDEDNDIAPAMIDALGSRVVDLRTLAGTTALPDRALTDWGAPIAQAVPVALRSDPTARAAAIGEAFTTVDATLGGVRIAESSDLNLLADSGDVPVTVINELDRPVTVTVDLASLSPSLQVEDHPVATIPAGQELLVPVTVEAVSSGNVSVSVVLLGPEGDLISDVSRFSIRIRADWGTAATAGFTVLLVLLLIAGLVRTVRRGRKDTRTRPGSTPMAPEAAHAAAAPAGEGSDDGAVPEHDKGTTDD